MGRERQDERDTRGSKTRGMHIRGLRAYQVPGPRIVIVLVDEVKTTHSVIVRLYIWLCKDRGTRETSQRDRSYPRSMASPFE